MVFYIPEDILTDFVSESSGHWYEHRFRKGGAHKFFYKGMIVAEKRPEIITGRTETQSHSKLKEETDMEVAEIRLDGIQQKNLFFTPLIKPGLGTTFLYDTIQHLTQEHRHCVLVKIVPDAHKGTAYRQIPDRKEIRFSGIHNIGLKDIERQKKGHGLFIYRPDYKTLPSIVFAESMDDYGIFSEFRGVEYYQRGVAGHCYLRL